MDKSYFNVQIEFDGKKVDSIIQSTITNHGKGYVCSIESNNLTVANKNPAFLAVVNGAMVNLCDGSMLAKILGVIHGKPFQSNIGADLFIKYVNMGRYKQYFLGNTRPVLDGLRENLSKIDPAIASMSFEELPFRKVEEFDYKGIATKINSEKPDIIWVSLGAPKQEFFMARLLPYLDQGIMFGFGAIFNFNAGIGQVKRAPGWMLKLNMEWLYRAFEEPRKNIPRYWGFIKLLPGLIISEISNR
ncbi:MAG: WecB/TagA/CpsF family glycosyltransferase [Flavobacterium sp.]|nr:WecB/TagA/CpsF family glycosyltransferase [Flavobacterium sp.]